MAYDMLYRRVKLRSNSLYYLFIVSTMSCHTCLPSKPLITHHLDLPSLHLLFNCLHLFFLACDKSFFFSEATLESFPTQQSHIDASELSQSDGKSEDVSTAICSLVRMHWKTLDILKAQ